jgi:2-dehydropantoate 2-reductase
MPRYVVIGAGAIGGTIGACLQLAGREVVLVARGEHGAAIRADGLLLRRPDRQDRVHTPCVSTPAEVEWRDDDVAVLATKVHQATSALVDLAAAAPASITVACATNGLDGERQALRLFAGVQGIVVALPADHLTPGVVGAYSAPVPGILDVGRYPAGVDDVTTTIAADLTAAGFASRPDPDVMRRKRAKLFMNLANVLEAAAGGRGDTSTVWAAARDEAQAVLRAAGLDWTSDEDDAARREESGLRMQPIAGQRRQGGSTWQSLARGAGDTEADYLNGEIVLLGRLHGVSTPVNERLQALARRLAAAGAEPGSVDAEELVAELL